MLVTIIKFNDLVNIGLVINRQVVTDNWSHMYTAFSTGDKSVLEKGNSHLDAGLTLLDEYNALEALAAEVGAEIQY